MLILTAIVVGVATTARGLALVVRIHEAYGTRRGERDPGAGRRTDDELIDHLPALQVVVLPLMAAPLCVLLRGRGGLGADARRCAWSRRCAGTSLLFARVLRRGPIAYAFGGWAAPWGIEYRVDALSGFVLLLVTLTVSRWC